MTEPGLRWPRWSTVALLVAFVATLVLYLAVRPDPPAATTPVPGLPTSIAPTEPPAEATTTTTTTAPSTTPTSPGGVTTTSEPGGSSGESVTTTTTTTTTTPAAGAPDTAGTGG